MTQGIVNVNININSIYKNIKNNFKKIIIDILLLAMKSLVFFKRIAVAFFILLFYPLVVVFRFVFFKILVKIYLGYFSFIKKIGWDKFKGSPLFFLLSRKTVHILVVILTVVFSLVGFIENGKAKTISEKAGKTIIAGLISNEFSEFDENELIEETFNEEMINAQTQLKYLGNFADVEKETSAVLNAEEEQTLVDFSRPDGEVIVKPEIATTKISKKARKEAIEYVVLPGDTISTIAYEFDISVNTILWENNLSAYSLIRPGDKLIILPSSGLTHKVASGENMGGISKKYGVEQDQIMEANKMTESSKLAVGQKLFIPGGVKTVYKAPTPSASSYNPIAIIKDMVKPASSQVAPSNKMAWPTDGARITQYYSWRHQAIDIANKLGTPLYAADAGVINFVGWKNGYGNTIIVDHGGGKRTLYAHLSKFYVEKGQRVDKGESIGAMGSTGWSTGPHLHFEIVINGVKYNPLNYIK